MSALMDRYYKTAIICFMAALMALTEVKHAIILEV